MISFSPATPPKFNTNSKSVRVRVVGQHGIDGLLYCVMCEKSTSIELVFPGKTSQSVIKFPSYLDIVSADLSEDLSIISYTERIIDVPQIRFKLTLCYIHQSITTKPILSDSPIDSFFVPRLSQNYYQIIYMTGPTILHCRVVFNEVHKSIDVYRQRSGIYIVSCTKWFFNRNTWQLSCFHKTNATMLTIFSFYPNGQFGVFNTPIEDDVQTILPPELSLSPSVPSQLPIYNFSNSHFCVIYTNHNYGLLEQIYYGEDSLLSFCVMEVKTKYVNIISIPDISPDLPINFIAFKTIAFAFVVNKFLCLVDFSQSPPNIFLMPGGFAPGPISTTAVEVGSSNNIVDLKTGKVFRAEIRLQSLPQIPLEEYIDRSVVRGIAVISARKFDKICFKDILKKLVQIMSSERTPIFTTYFFQQYFQSLKDEIQYSKQASSTKNKAFKMSSQLTKISPKDTLKQSSSCSFSRTMIPISITKSSSDSAIENDSSLSCFKKSLGAVLDEVQSIDQVCLTLSAFWESQDADNPVPNLEKLALKALDSTASHALKLQLERANLFSTYTAPIREINYWATRIPSSVNFICTEK